MGDRETCNGYVQNIIVRAQEIIKLRLYKKNITLEFIGRYCLEGNEVMFMD